MCLKGEISRLRHADTFKEKENSLLLDAIKGNYAINTYSSPHSQDIALMKPSVVFYYIGT